MTPNIFKTIIYHLKTIVDCLSPEIFITAINLVISFRSITIIIQQMVSNVYKYMAGTINLARNNCYFLFFFQNCLSTLLTLNQILLPVQNLNFFELSKGYRNNHETYVWFTLT